MFNYSFFLLVLFTLIFIFNKYSEAAIACTNNANCNNGVCNSASVCVCNKGYADQDGQACIYKQKDKTTAFVLSLFLGPFGADWFYLASGNGAYVFGGFMKLFTGLFSVIGTFLLCCTFIFSRISKDSIFERVGTIIGVILIILIGVFSLTNFIWYFVDWIRILTDTFKDGNNYSLKDWN